MLPYRLVIRQHLSCIFGKYNASKTYMDYNIGKILFRRNITSGKYW